MSDRQTEQFPNSVLMQNALLSVILFKGFKYWTKSPVLGTFYDSNTGLIKVANGVSDIQIPIVIWKILEPKCNAYLILSFLLPSIQRFKHDLQVQSCSCFSIQIMKPNPK